MKEWQFTTCLSVCKLFKAVMNSTNDEAFDNESDRISSTARATRNKTILPSYNKASHMRKVV